MPLTFLVNDPAESSSPPKDFWKILIVDDDPDVHSVTETVMQGLEIIGRGLQFFHARTSQEARAILVTEPEIALVLLDVVMETERSGLDLIQVIRHELGLFETRIILRTGQPGFAPEYEAIRDYDINDYRTKSELSYAKLLTAITAALRSYQQIRTIAESNETLEFIIKAAPELLQKSSVEEFETALMAMIGSLLDPRYEWVLIQAPFDYGISESAYPSVLAASAAYLLERGHELSDQFEDPQGRLPAALTTIARTSLADKSNHFTQKTASLYLPGFEHGDLLLLVASDTPFRPQSRRILEVFGVAVAMGYQNVNLVLQLRHLAFTDALTGLMNRTGFLLELDRHRRHEIGQQRIALIDIEGFSEINEVLGHDYGDELLKHVAERLATCFEDSVSVARVSADGFALLGRVETIQPDVIIAIFSKPFVIQHNSLYLRIVAGFVSLDEVQGDGADLLKDAYLAVKIAKERKQSRFFHYTQKIAEDNRNRIVLLEELQRTLETTGLSVHYQPQFQIQSGQLTGFEALIRWHRADGTAVSPADFIPLAEQSGLIVDIGDWVFQQACEQVRAWNNLGLRGFRVAVNISVRQFHNPGFIDYLENTLEHFGVPSSQIELEVTESMAMTGVQEVIRVLNQLKGIGFKLALDDFGTGFSSLSYLQQLPIDRIKIDRSFVTNIHTMKSHRTIAGTIVQLGKGLGLEIIAEGVEDEHQAEVLTQLECDEAQGFYYAMPMAGDAATNWLKNRT